MARPHLGNKRGGPRTPRTTPIAGASSGTSPSSHPFEATGSVNPSRTETPPAQGRTRLPANRRGIRPGQGQQQPPSPIAPPPEVPEASMDASSQPSLPQEVEPSPPPQPSSPPVRRPTPMQKPDRPPPAPPSPVAQKKSKLVSKNSDKKPYSPISPPTGANPAAQSPIAPGYAAPTDPPPRSFTPLQVARNIASAVARGIKRKETFMRGAPQSEQNINQREGGADSHGGYNPRGKKRW